MNKKTVTILIISMFLFMAVATFAVIFVVFNGDISKNKPDVQKVLIEDGYFNTRVEENGAIHIVKTGCKIYYKNKYKKQVNKALEGCTEDINAVIGEYFRNKDIDDITATGCFEQTELYIKNEINAMLNEKIKSDESLPIEYVTDVILFNTIYQ